MTDSEKILACNNRCVQEGRSIHALPEDLALIETPAPVVKKIQDAVLAITQEQDFIAKLAAQGAVPFANDAAESAKIMANELTLWTPIVKKLNIQMD